MLKRLFYRAALKAERIADQLFSRTGKDREIDAYIGYATSDQIILRGRVLSKLRHSSAVEGQTRLTNLRQMLGMFLTDEVRDVTVRCGDVKALTDEEGYFILLLPRDARTGWGTEQVYIEDSEVATLCPFLVPAPDARFMIISDIDGTMLETGAYSLMRNLYTTLHVWMPQLMQGFFELSEHVIGCGHVSGLIVRLFTCRGPVWRYADRVQITTASSGLCVV